MSKPLPELPDLLPGFAERLETRAEEIAATHRAGARDDSSTAARVDTPGIATSVSRGRRRRLAGGAILAGFVAVSGAYATGLWRPELGSNADDPPVVSERAVAPDLLDRLAVLRRPQTETDRGAAAAYALKFPATGQTGIQTRAVRTLPLPRGGLAVLVPTVDLASGAQALCLTVQLPGETSAARACTSTEEFAAGRLLVAVGAPNSAAVEAERTRRRQDAQRGAATGGGVQQDAAPPDRSRVVGVAPDGVRAVWVGGDGPARVTDNLFDVTTDLAPADLRVRWDG